MSEKTLELEIPLLLPGVEAEDDACLARLENALQNQKGLQRAHLERDQQPLTLCLHYDPDALSLAAVRRLAERAGAGIVNRYHLGPLDLQETLGYVRHHVRTAGFTTGPLFTDEAVARIFEYTKGIPRRIRLRRGLHHGLDGRSDRPEDRARREHHPQGHRRH